MTRDEVLREEPAWLEALAITARNPLMKDEQIVPIVNEGTIEAVYAYIVSLRERLADANDAHAACQAEASAQLRALRERLAAVERERDRLLVNAKAGDDYLAQTHAERDRFASMLHDCENERDAWKHRAEQAERERDMYRQQRDEMDRLWSEDSALWADSLLIARSDRDAARAERDAMRAVVEAVKQHLRGLKIMWHGSQGHAINLRLSGQEQQELAQAAYFAIRDAVAALDATTPEGGR